LGRGANVAEFEKIAVVVQSKLSLDPFHCMRPKNLLATLAACPRDAETLNTLLVALEAQQITTAEDLIYSLLSFR